MNDCCEHNSKCKYGVGSNMPGYMPDSDVAHFANYADALASFAEHTERAIGDYIEGELAHLKELGDDQAQNAVDAADEALVQQRKAVLKNARKCVDRQMQIGNYVYWLSAI